MANSRRRDKKKNSHQFSLHKKKPVPWNKKPKPKKKRKADEIDYLTNLPNKILLKIIALVPMSSYLDLAQTSQHLRYVMHTSAAEICNICIKSYHSLESLILESIEIDGWLTPTALGMKTRHETRWVDPGLRLYLHQPGPQYLYFLEKNALSFKGKHLRIGWRELQHFMDELNQESPVVGIHKGQDTPKWMWLREMVWYYGVPG